MGLPLLCRSRVRMKIQVMNDRGIVWRDWEATRDDSRTDINEGEMGQWKCFPGLGDKCPAVLAFSASPQTAGMGRKGAQKKKNPKRS